VADASSTGIEVSEQMKYLTKFDCMTHFAYMYLKQTKGRWEALQEVPGIRKQFLVEGYMPDWVNEAYLEYLHEATTPMPPKVTITKTTVYSKDDIADLLGAAPNQVEVRVLATTGMPSFEIIVTERITESQNATNHD
jgi:hypothetical protein